MIHVSQSYCYFFSGFVGRVRKNVVVVLAVQGEMTLFFSRHATRGRASAGTC